MLYGLPGLLLSTSVVTLCDEPAGATIKKMFACLFYDVILQLEENNICDI